MRQFICALTLFVFVSGCSEPEVPLPELAPVSGTVTLDDAPVANALVLFLPEQKGQASVGRTDEQGKYSLNYEPDVPGAVVGTHLVRISTGGETQNEKGEVVDERPESIPARYNVKSDMKQTVEPNGNTIDFALKSK